MSFEHLPGGHCNLRCSKPSFGPQHFAEPPPKAARHMECVCAEHIVSTSTFRRSVRPPDSGGQAGRPTRLTGQLQVLHVPATVLVVVRPPQPRQGVLLETLLETLAISTLVESFLDFLKKRRWVEQPSLPPLGPAGRAGPRGRLGPERPRPRRSPGPVRPAGGGRDGRRPPRARAPGATRLPGCRVTGRLGISCGEQRVATGEGGHRGLLPALPGPPPLPSPHLPDPPRPPPLPHRPPPLPHRRARGPGSGVPGGVRLPHTRPDADGARAET